jgi:hypothetical protein
VRNIMAGMVTITEGSQMLQAILAEQKQADVADALSQHLGRKVWPSNLSKWASGTHSPKFPMMDAMRAVLGIEFSSWHTPVADTREAA